MKKGILFLVYFLVVGFVAKADFNTIKSIQDSVRTVEQDGEKFIEYLVSPGETLYRISTKYQIPITRLMEINPELTEGLKSGQVLLIPLSEAKKQSSKPQVAAVSQKVITEGDKKIHVVEAGETLYSLARVYGVTVGDLLKWNGMELKAGQKLVVGYQAETENVDGPIDQPIKADKPKDETRADVHIYTSTDLQGDEYTVYDYDTNMKQVLIVPFDPHLYFSDADDEIAKVSRIPRVKVREVFRKRLNALLAPRGYESIYLLGGKSKDTLTDLNKIYSSVTYNYQDIIYSDSYLESMARTEKESKPDTEKKETFNMKSWIDKTREKLVDPQNDKQAHREKFMGKYFGVRVTDPRFWDYFGRKYSVDYYVFINQFEVITDYEHCLDRSSGNYQRYFIAHFSIFDREGNQIAGNKYKLYYDSNTNNINKICSDNMLKIADRVMLEIPPSSD